MAERPFLILIVIDGFGCRKDAEWNAIAQADTPRFHDLWRNALWTTLEASGLAVGLPAGQMGNSEVGHLNIGAGRVVDQDIVRISKAFERHEVKLDNVRGKNVHLTGLLSDGGVHSLQSHLHGLIDVALESGAKNVYIHAILDGRDTPPKSAEKYLDDLVEFIKDKPNAHLATIIGRYFTMDRDKRWERVQRGYDLMTLGVGTQTKDPLETVRRFYEQNVTDEFMEPIAVLTSAGAHEGRVEDGDVLIFFNFRADRMRQIVTAFKQPVISSVVEESGPGGRRDSERHRAPRSLDSARDDVGFTRAMTPRVEILTMNQYREDFGLPVIFPPVAIRNNLGEVLSKNGLTQLRIAETEKYAHVTFFFNGGSDTQFEGEQRILVPSPKVATYDLKPEMSVFEVVDKVLPVIEQKQVDVVIMNIANPDMVGHTGVMKAATEAVHDTDVAIDRILKAVEKVDGVALITADHGNCELMFDSKTNQPHTAHTTNPVPLILFDPKKRYGKLHDGGALENVAPTILTILGVAQPAEMTAKSLLA